MRIAVSLTEVTINYVDSVSCIMTDLTPEQVVVELNFIRSRMSLRGVPYPIGARLLGRMFIDRRRCYSPSVPDYKVTVDLTGGVAGGVAGGYWSVPVCVKNIETGSELRFQMILCSIYLSKLTIPTGES